MENRVMEKGGLSTLGEPMPELFDTGFERFWKAWPASTRKGAKSECRKKWDKHYCETQTDQIIKHIEWLKTTEQWLKGNGAFIPAPLVYLNQQRWDGAEVPEIKPKSTIDPALAKIEADNKRAVPIPEHIRLKMASLKGRL
jgi:hypothetical protein